MTSIPTLPALRSAVSYSPGPLNRAAAPSMADAAPSSIVTLSTDGLASAQRMPAWLRFRDAGSALLEAFGSGPVAAIEPPPLPDDVDHGFSLNVVTAGGATVTLGLASRGNELLVRIGADAELSEDERAALAGLAEGFQDAIDGMAMDTPQLRLGKLSRLDGGLLQSIELHAAVTLPTVPPEIQTLDFHIDGEQRSVHVDSPAGTLDLSVKTGMPEALGTRQQQDKAIASYLKQFDQAARRGHGDAHLTAMFRDAFSDLSRTASRDAPADASRALAREEHAVLTGLADFSASVTQAPQRINPARLSEVDGFHYEVAQETRIGGASWADRSLAQSQRSRLSAQFHEPLREGGQLAFNFSSESQNYRYREIDDTARSDATLERRDGKLRLARLEQSAEQSERVREYVLGRMMSDTTAPAQQQLLRDLVAILDPYRAGRDGEAREESREEREARREQALQSLSEDLLLLGDSAELANRRRPALQ